MNCVHCAGYERGCRGAGGRGDNPELPGHGGCKPRDLLVDAARRAPSTFSGRVSNPSIVSEELRRREKIKKWIQILPEKLQLHTFFCQKYELLKNVEIFAWFSLDQTSGVDPDPIGSAFIWVCGSGSRATFFFVGNHIFSSLNLTKQLIAKV